MSSIEERLARDIAAVTGGVVVTDSDLQEARKAVDEGIDSKRRRDRLRTVAVAAAAAVVLVVAGVTAYLTLGDDDATVGPAGPEPSVSNPDADYLTGSSPTPELVDGVWRVDNGEIMLKFSANGTVRFDDRGTLFSHPIRTGTYTIAGDLITVTTTDDPQSGCIGTEYAMRASLPETGALRYIPDTATGPCSPMPPGQGVLEQVLPTSQSLAELVFSKDRGWHPLSGKVYLYGVWQAEGGGHVLEIDRGGTYFVADDSGEPVDRGQWSLRGSDLTLTSSVRSTECSEGDQLVLRAVEQENSGTSGMRATVTQNTCGGAWTPAAWILIPHVGS
ncbi:MAG: hypothetical protein QOJ03_626 [Frankiaceae bacterium]|nr:hypothetical protein [Frankiaceae bacterium]